MWDRWLVKNSSPIREAVIYKELQKKETNDLLFYIFHSSPALFKCSKSIIEASKSVFRPQVGRDNSSFEEASVTSQIILIYQN